MFNVCRAYALPLKAVLLVFFLSASASGSHSVAYAQMAADPTSAPSILNREQASAILPATVFFHGQSASIQGRNSAGLKTGGKLVLATVVDTSGYSSTVQQTYQSYLLTEVPLLIGGQRLAAGAYGFGFVDGAEMVVMDIGGGEVLKAKVSKDESLARPNPLQILKNTAGPGFRLYMGRTYVVFSPADK